MMRTGWHEIEGQKYFVLKDETIGPKGTELVVLDASAVGPYETKGSLESWQNSVGQLVANHFLPILAMSAAFAGPLLDPAGQDGGGAEFLRRVLDRKDDNNPGRSFGLGPRIVSGRLCPELERDSKWIGGCGRLRQRHCPHPRRIERPGCPRGRSRNLCARKRDGQIAEWRGTLPRERPRPGESVVMSTGEIPMETKVAEDKGQKARAGQAVRMPDILADRGKGFGAFSEHGILCRRWQARRRVQGRSEKELRHRRPRVRAAAGPFGRRPGGCDHAQSHRPVRRCNGSKRF